jgi:hypothetical protein
VNIPESVVACADRLSRQPKRPSPACQLTPQDDQLMSEHRILRFRRNFDLNGEARTARAKQSSQIIPPA